MSHRWRHDDVKSGQRKGPDQRTVFARRPKAISHLFNGTIMPANRMELEQHMRRRLQRWRRLRLCAAVRR